MYIIDGHNLIPKIPGMNLAAADDEQQLIELLQEFCRISRKRVEVYFDNAPPGQARARHYGVVAVRFVRAGSTADDAIRERLLKMGRSARNWIVVSSDQRVQFSAREAGAKYIASEAFARQMAASLAPSTSTQEKKEDINLSDAEVAQWEDLFRKRNKKG